MKISALSLSFLAVLLSMAACNKNTSSSSSSKPTLVLSKTTVKRGEPLVIASSTLSSNTSLRWSVNPPGSSWITGYGSQASIVFSTAGSFNITATYVNSTDSVAYDSSMAVVNVSDSIYGDTGVAICNLVRLAPFHGNDQLILTPVAYSDSGLSVFAHTLQPYQYYPYLSYGTNINTTAGSFEFDFNGVVENVCATPGTDSTQAVASLPFTPLTNGTHPLLINYNGSSYQGSVTVTDNSCVFTWNYTSGVIISALTISKQ